MKKNRLSLADLGLIVEDIEFSMPDPKETILTNAPPSSAGANDALSMVDGGDDSPGINWKPSMQDQPKDAPQDREAEAMKSEKSGIKSGSQQGGAKGEQSSDVAAKAGEQAEDNKPDFLKKKTEESFKLSPADIGLFLEGDENPFAKEEGEQEEGQQAGGQQSGGQRGGQQSGGQQGGQAGGSEEVNAAPDGAQSATTDNGVQIDSELLTDMLKAAAADQPDENMISMIVQAVSDCCQGKTMTVADAPAIMSKLKELAGGQQGGQMGGQQAPMGGQQGSQMGTPPGQQGDQPGAQGPEQIDSMPPGDGDVAGPEGGQQHEGKTKLMAGLGESVKGKPTKNAKGKPMTLAEAWIMGVPGVGVNACLGETAFDGEELDEDTIELRKMARKSGNPNWFNVGR